MNAHNPTLRELQHAMHNSLRKPADNGLSAYIRADGWSVEERLNIHRNTTVSALATALRLSYPIIAHLVGAEFFEGATRLFSDQAAPDSALLDEYGANFPEFLAKLPQAASLPYLPDVARLEWQVSNVLHAQDAIPLEIARLAQLNEAELLQMCFVRHPAVTLLHCTFPADTIWYAVLERDDNAMTAINLADGPVWLLVHRTESSIHVVRLSEDEWRCTTALFSGQPLHAVLTIAPCADTHALLAAHLIRGCFTDVRLSAFAP
ncbi:DNA-binding domain-containing protein [Glaciimonas sp. CA11.2]|uniref:DNA-binding domain-containing protein n=1 Tax=unclassified Glaciimonas TaxID=2644401 RepID=UPI002AB46D41|nr:MULTISPECIES: DNA-binding domain-containing protein [unclassified Glaciimonas]MDY7544737.1 DNA-binding domain-containing protein [Glaciimonas sp. CA11.2]MEB0011965.1 DNA-binding domain-containing protein [Glaciimonas sp. Cout2]MEB0082800.1 DNA-binding domain-containing protein [Glaciimonas sp. Gout2]MEB0163262.1 DNA-binding domain-containing protein [Glaciimonas sp. CA11.2]